MPSRALVVAVGLAFASCQHGPPADEADPAPRKPPAIERAAPPKESAAEVAPTEAQTEDACQKGMKLVDVHHCPDIERTCLKDEYNKPNHITICHKFAEERGRCNGDERRERFCIDEFEYPNKEGARSPVMVDFYDAMALCGEAGKRLCWESEWIAACEGPDKTPFPYGYARDPKKCNIDNPWIKPDLDKMYDKDPTISGPHLQHLDQGVASGSKPECKSGFGVHDQTGNVDEWVLLETKRGTGGWAGLKGGAWGHVRNACRPVTTSHAPEFKYYFVSFRCCADAKPPAADKGDPIWKAPPIPTDKHKPLSLVDRGFTPKSK